MSDGGMARGMACLLLINACSSNESFGLTLIRVTRSMDVDVSLEKEDSDLVISETFWSTSEFEFNDVSVSEVIGSDSLFREISVASSFLISSCTWRDSWNSLILRSCIQAWE